MRECQIKSFPQLKPPCIIWATDDAHGEDCGMGYPPKQATLQVSSARVGRLEAGKTAGGQRLACSARRLDQQYIVGSHAPTQVEMLCIVTRIKTLTTVYRWRWINRVTTQAMAETRMALEMAVMKMARLAIFSWQCKDDNNSKTTNNNNNKPNNNNKATHSSSKAHNIHSLLCLNPLMINSLDQVV